MRSRKTETMWPSEPMPLARAHVPQRVDSLDAHARITVIYQRVEQSLANHVLERGAIESFEELSGALPDFDPCAPL